MPSSSMRQMILPWWELCSSCNQQHLARTTLSLINNGVCECLAKWRVSASHLRPDETIGRNSESWWSYLLLMVKADTWTIGIAEPSSLHHAFPIKFMQIGLRPRLKGRPSFYDLIRQRSIDQLSISTAKPVEEQPSLVHSSVPLPASPTEVETISVQIAAADETRPAPKRKDSVKMVPVSLESQQNNDLNY